LSWFSKAAPNFSTLICRPFHLGAIPQLPTLKHLYADFSHKSHIGLITFPANINKIAPTLETFVYLGMGPMLDTGPALSPTVRYASFELMAGGSNASSTLVKLRDALEKFPFVERVEFDREVRAAECFKNLTLPATNPLDRRVFTVLLNSRFASKNLIEALVTPLKDGVLPPERAQLLRRLFQMPEFDDVKLLTSSGTMKRLMEKSDLKVVSFFLDELVFGQEAAAADPGRQRHRRYLMQFFDQGIHRLICAPTTAGVDSIIQRWVSQGGRIMVKTMVSVLLQHLFAIAGT
jgi:hypothetical protein